VDPRIIHTQTGQLKQRAQFRQGKHGSDGSARAGDVLFAISQITIVQSEEGAKVSLISTINKHI